MWTRCHGSQSVAGHTVSQMNDDVINTYWRFVILPTLLCFSKNFGENERFFIRVILIGELFPQFFDIFFRAIFQSSHIFLFFPPKYWNVNELDIFGSGGFHEWWQNASVYWYISPIISNLWKLWKKRSPIRMNQTELSCTWNTIFRSTCRLYQPYRIVSTPSRVTPPWNTESSVLASALLLNAVVGNTSVLV